MSIQEAFENYYAEYPEHNVRANDSLLNEASTRPVTVRTLREAAQRLGNRLAVSQQYQQAFAEFYKNHSEYSGVEANTNILTESHHGEDITATTLEELLENPNIKSQ